MQRNDKRDNAPPLPGGQGQCADYGARQHGRARRRRAERGDDGVMYRGKAAADCDLTTLHFCLS